VLKRVKSLYKGVESKMNVLDIKAYMGKENFILIVGERVALRF